MPSGAGGPKKWLPATSFRRFLGLAATVGSFDGTTLELVLPPGGDFRARKLEEKADEVREVLTELFGITPQLRYTIRTGTVVDLDAEEPAPTPEAAEELVRQQFGAEVVEEE